MVRSAFFVFLILATVSTYAESKKIQLTQKDVAELVLKQGPKTKEVNDTFLQNRIIPAKARLGYDWTATAATGYEFDKTQQFSPSTIPGSNYRRLISTLSLSKSFTSGSVLGIDYSRLSQKATYDYIVPDVTPTGPTSLTQDLFDVTLEQYLLGNAFGRADRATIDSADKTFEAAKVLRANSLQDVVLETIQAYWDAYVAKETLQESLSSRDRYKNLVKQVKRKTSFGYSAPGELAQAQAEYEGLVQKVKSASTDYLTKTEALATLLNLPPDTDIEFKVDTKVPELPSLPPVKVDDLRVIRAQKLLVDAAKADLTASRSKSYPDVNFVGKVYSSGYDETSGGSFSSAASGVHPRYYAGLKFQYNFGSNYQNEDILNKKVTKELQETVLSRKKMEQNDALAEAQREVQSTYAIVQSAIQQNDYRVKAARELSNAYGQGRTDIKVLIDAINNQFATEVALSQAIGNYQFALNKWAATRDELIPDSTGGEQ